MTARSLIAPAALALALGAAMPATAQQATMTEEERAIFREEVRAYLLDQPEVLMEAIAVLEARAAEEEMARDGQLVEEYSEAIFEGGHWVGGNPDGDITLVEFMDYRCGYCRRAFGEVSELLAQDGEIRLILVEYPILGEQSILASRFALAVRELAGDDAYEAVHDALMLMRTDVNEQSLRPLAEEQGLNFEEVAAAMASDDVTDTIARNRELGAALQITGTPSFIVEDMMVRGYLPYAEMASIVEEIRASAE